MASALSVLALGLVVAASAVGRHADVLLANSAVLVLQERRSRRPGFGDLAKPVTILCE